MATKDFHVYFQRLSRYRWVVPSAAVMSLAAVSGAIAADPHSMADRHDLLTQAEATIEAELDAIASTSSTTALQHNSSEERTLLPLETDTSEAEQSPVEGASEASTVGQSASEEADADEEPSAPSDFRPNPEYTAPLPPVDSNPPSLPPVQQLPPPSPDPFMESLFGAPQTPDFDTYRLGPGDSFFVNVRQFPDLSFQATLDIQGNVIVPLQGVVSFNGRTLQETEALISQIYDQYVVNPDVSITLVAQRGVEVTILGEVVRPGYYPLGAPQIAAALLSAGGTTGDADLRSVSIQRRLPDGQLLERTIDLFTPLSEGEEIPNVALQDGDVILVERLDPAALDEYDRTLVARSTLAQPVITVRFLNYGSGSLGGATSGSLTAIDMPNGSRFADALVRVSLNPDTSNLNEVALIRFDEEAGQAVTTTLNGHDAFRGLPAENPPLRDNDVIIVNRTALAKITYALNTFTQPFRDVLGFLLFFDQLAGSAESLFGP
ncbi:polysaccharide biosynthesis/export family protein [Oscillatoria sp. CS-180]|uniref:polysaccharide biosynthesis/export family protein n=1 Tax=Oscillatoria sp. CS-180 TaxID=3021720 RepID=UPI002330BBA6|nr:polysaccharide biosynthesis/export family protein [Oscillatoria sp. CS-180]MDB9528032.1 polysaccharide biosynthesis/export family protein [Oscillatoria sp. CS-180]